MGFETTPTLEPTKDVPKITTEEWIKYSGRNVDDEEFEKWMEKKGIKLNSGIAQIDLDGEVVRINTSEENFGDIIEDPDTVLEKSGV